MLGNNPHTNIVEKMQMYELFVLCFAVFYFCPVKIFKKPSIIKCLLSFRIICKKKLNILECVVFVWLYFLPVWKFHFPYSSLFVLKTKLHFLSVLYFSYLLISKNVVKHANKNKCGYKNDLCYNNRTILFLW